MGRSPTLGAALLLSLLAPAANADDRDAKPVTEHQQVLDSDGKLSAEGDVVDGLKQGTWLSYDGQGRVHFETPYADGVRQGVGVQYTDGCGAQAGRRVPVARTTWVDGLKDGPYFWYHCDGSVNVQGMHRRDERHGEWQWISEAGKLVKEGGYLCGREFGSWKYYKTDGSLREQEEKQLPDDFRCSDELEEKFDPAVEAKLIAEVCEGPASTSAPENACMAVESCRLKREYASGPKHKPLWCSVIKGKLRCRLLIRTKLCTAGGVRG